MNICRICLANGALKDIFETVESSNNAKKYVNIIKFCLDIQVTEQSTTTTKLCLNCARKLVSFFKFKSLAHKNDEYFMALHEDVVIKLEAKAYNENCIKSEEDCLSDDDVSIKEETKYDVDNKSEESVVNDTLSPDCDSDDELLSVTEKKNSKDIKDTVKKIEKRERAKLISKKKIFNIKKPKCEECGKNVSDLKAHSVLHQPESLRKRYKCKDCVKVFSSATGMYKHYRVTHLGIKSICKLCNKAVSCLSTHKAAHHHENLKHVCPNCDHRFVTASTLATHMASHTKDRPFECEMCPMRFKIKGHLNSHVRAVHNKEKTHLCQMCSKTFFTSTDLMNHIRSHTKESPYKCPDCGKCFRTVSILRSHRELHGGVKKYSCTLCDMTFMKQGYLNSHMISHTKEKRHECKYCGVKFGRSDHRKRHEFTAHQKHLITAGTT